MKNKIFNFFFKKKLDEKINKKLNEYNSIESLYPFAGFDYDEKKIEKPFNNTSLILNGNVSPIPVEFFPSKTFFTVVSYLNIGKIKNLENKITLIKEIINKIDNDEDGITFNDIDEYGYDKKNWTPTIGSSDINNILFVKNKDDTYELVTIISSPKSSKEFINFIKQNKELNMYKLYHTKEYNAHKVISLRNSRQFIALLCMILCANIKLKYDYKTINENKLIISKKLLNNEFYVDYIDILFDKSPKIYNNYIKNTLLPINKYNQKNYGKFQLSKKITNKKIDEELIKITKINIKETQDGRQKEKKLIQTNEQKENEIQVDRQNENENENENEIQKENNQIIYFALFLDSTKNHFFLKSFMNFKYNKNKKEKKNFYEKKNITKKDNFIYDILKKNCGNNPLKKFIYPKNKKIYSQKKVFFDKNFESCWFYEMIYVPKNMKNLYYNSNIIKSNNSFFAYPIFLNHDTEKNKEQEPKVWRQNEKELQDVEQKKNEKKPNSEVQKENEIQVERQNEKEKDIQDNKQKEEEDPPKKKQEQKEEKNSINTYNESITKKIKEKEIKNKRKRWITKTKKIKKMCKKNNINQEYTFFDVVKNFCYMNHFEKNKYKIKIKKIEILIKNKK